jgi:NitT/TauT family transport system permease protein
LNFIGEQVAIFCDAIVNINARKNPKIKDETTKKSVRTANIFIGLWYGGVAIISLGLLAFLLQFIFKSISAREVAHAIVLGSYTSLRIITLIIICSLIWVPIGVWIGLRPKVSHAAQPIAQFLAAFPANLLYPVIFIAIIKWNLNVNVWCTPLIILGTQWYILFNVIAGTTALPKDLIYVANNFDVKGWIWWKRFILPGIFPYFITGAITAAGGAWNASIVAEVVSWGQTKLVAQGIGAYFTHYSTMGDFPRVALAIGVICLFVLIFNRLIWQPLYNLAEKRFQIN